MAETQLSRTTWWGKFELGLEQVGRWRVGPLDLWIRRTALDWRYGLERSDEALETALEVQVPCPEQLVAGQHPDEQGRFGFARTEGTIELVPALADRPVVARPSVPFFVPARQTAELWVSTPVWIRLRAGAADLTEIACTRPSDTWFGSNTRGELSYATRTHLRRTLEELPLRPHRAVSRVTVENASGRTLALERLSLPVPQLSLYAGPSGTLWTEHVSLKNEDDDGGLAQVSLGKGAPQAAGGGARVAAPRAPQGRSFGSLVFGGLFEVGT